VSSEVHAVFIEAGGVRQPLDDAQPDTRGTPPCVRIARMEAAHSRLERLSETFTVLCKTSSRLRSKLLMSR
jgi:hypothetical protein